MASIQYFDFGWSTTFEYCTYNSHSAEINPLKGKPKKINYWASYARFQENQILHLEGKTNLPLGYHNTLGK